MNKSDSIEILPNDKYNRELISNVHPANRQNPEPAKMYNLVVIGAGTAGLVTAAGAAGLGAKVALIEHSFMGGDCLNVGCVPSKCIIQSSRVAEETRNAQKYGIYLDSKVDYDFSAVMERMRRLRSQISEHDSVERFRKLGIDVFLGRGRFAESKIVEVNGLRLPYKKAVIATGARPAIPPIEGLQEAGFLTNETVFSLTERPDHILLLGAGPIGCELAQSFKRLGSKVTIIARTRMLSKEDPDASEVLKSVFNQEGVNVLSPASVQSVKTAGDKKIITVHHNDSNETIEVDEILVGIGRIPNIEEIDLDLVGVKSDRKFGIKVNDMLQTTNPHIYAAGDVCMAYKFTHAADAAARIVIQNALFKGRKKLSAIIIPRCTYTDPEIAHIGMYKEEAEQKGIAIDTFKVSMDDVDRAIVDGQTNGFVKVHVKTGTDKIIGATIVASHAGEMINEISLAMGTETGLGKLAETIHPYPTQAEAIKKVADAYNRTRLTSFIKNILTKWLAWQRRK